LKALAGAAERKASGAVPHALAGNAVAWQIVHPMGSSFDPQAFNEDSALKIAASLERVAAVFRTLYWEAGKNGGLTPLQIQILLFLRFHTRAVGRVSRLAREFHLTKATISDAVGSLEDKGLLERKPDPEDRRSFVLSLSAKGRRQCERLSSLGDSVADAAASLPPELQSQVQAGLFQILDSLRRDGIIELERMCFGCIHYEKRGADAHYCRLLQTPLGANDLRFDCPEHEPRETAGSA